MPVTVINVIAIPEDEEADAFARRWEGFAHKMKDAEGFVDAELRRNVGGGDPTFRFVAVNTWESEEAWRAAIAKAGFNRPSADAGGMRAHPAIYETVVRVERAASGG